MSDRNLIFTLAKVIIAAAWADGDLGNDEINVMKDLLFRLPRTGSEGHKFINMQEWAVLDMYIETPVPPEERAGLIDQLRTQLHTEEDRQLVLTALDDLVRADGHIGPEEMAVLQEVRTAITNLDLGFFGQLGRLLTGATQRRVSALDRAPNRERYLDDFIYNKVYYGVRRRLELGDGAAINIADNELRRLCALGGMLARVAQADDVVTDDEFKEMVELLQEQWHIAHTEALFVAEVAVSEISTNMDWLRLVREFYSSITPEQGERFLDLLFAVAAADGAISDQESDVIYQISRALGLAHKQFIDAKLRASAESGEL